jgi:drug/metabolite transporter (DMT)-like permease
VRRLDPAYLMLLATVSIWAFNFTVTKYALSNGFKPLAFSCLRFAAAAVIFTSLTYGRERTLNVGRRHLPLLLAAGVVGIYLNQISFVYAIQLTNASTVALLFGSLPIITALIAYAAGIERLHRRFWIAAAVSFAGVGLVVLGSGEAGFSADLLGNLLGVAGAATWAVYSVALVPLMRSYSPYRISAFALLLGTILLFPTAAIQIAEQDYSLEALVWAGFVFSIFGPLVLTNILWFTAIGRVGPSRATLVANLQPFLAAVFALVLLSESITALQLAGGAAIAIGILLARRRRPVAAIE